MIDVKRKHLKLHNIRWFKSLLSYSTFEKKLRDFILYGNTQMNERNKKKFFLNRKYVLIVVTPLQCIEIYGLTEKKKVLKDRIY